MEAREPYDPRASVLRVPSDIEADRIFLEAPNWPAKNIYPWELEILAREIILHSPDVQIEEQSLKKWSVFTGVVNKLKRLEDETYGIYRDKLAPRILLELHRIAHRQFPWQRPHNTIRLNRYYKIFGAPELDALMHRVLGMSAWELYILGLALAGNYLEYASLSYPPNIEIREISQETLNNFLKHFSRSLTDLREDIKESQRFDQDFAYSYDPLRAYPLIRMNFGGRNSLVCPLPPLLLNRFTDGVYYELCVEKDFAAPFGNSFQRYVGEVLQAAVVSSRATIHPETEYLVGRDRKDTVDWIVDDPTGVVFLECKTKRLRLIAKIEIVSTEVLDEELDVLASFIVQAYRTLEDCRAGCYPLYALNPTKPVYPLIVTLEDWYAIGDRILNALDGKVRTQLQEQSLDEGCLVSAPYSICSIDELERMAQIMNRCGIDAFMKPKVTSTDKRLWAFHSYMAEEFPGERKAIKDLFPNALLDRQVENSTAVMLLRQALEE